MNNHKQIYDFYENLEDYNPKKKIKMLVLFDDMIANVKAHKKFSPIVTEWFVEGGKPNISFAFT